jgi:serine/threonine-protein kinase HipA
VLIGGIRAGTLEQGRRTEFVYDGVYLQRQAPTPVSLSMPVRGQREWPQAKVLPWLDGLLPDSRDVRGRWAERLGVSANNPFALLAEMGRDCPGAVQICEEGEVDDVARAEGGLRELSEADVAERLAALSADANSWTVPGERWSLGGAQAKFALARYDGRWCEATGSTATTHIIKPGVAGFAGQALNEHLCMSAARILGIAVAETSYMEFDGRPAIVVSRYDRIGKDDTVRRIHQEDLCQALSFPPRKKYETDGGPGAAMISDLLRAHADDSSRWRFVEAVAFNYLIGASDAHAKNYSVLLSGNQVRLAPLYDVASSLPYDPTGDDSDLRKTAMAIAGQRNFGRVDSNNWHKFALRSGVDPGRLLDRVLELSERIPDAVATAAAGLPAVAVRQPLVQRLGDRLSRHLATV